MRSHQNCTLAPPAFGAVQSRPLDDAIAQRLLTAVTPMTIELALEARKRMLRLLINNIAVVGGPEPRLLQLRIRWQGGETETIKAYPRRADAARYPDVFVAKIRALAELYDDHEIVSLLNGEGVKDSTRKPFTVGMIRAIRHKHRIPGPSLPVGTLNVSHVRERYGVSLSVVYYWIERGIVSAVQHKPNAPYALTIDDETDRRLRK